MNTVLIKQPWKFQISSTFTAFLNTMCCDQKYGIEYYTLYWSFRQLGNVVLWN